MSYEVVQAPGHAILRQDYDAVFATEAEAQALCNRWRAEFPRVGWEVRPCEANYYHAGKFVPHPVNAQWVNGQVRRLDRPTRGPIGAAAQP